MTTVAVTLEVQIQDPARVHAWIETLRAQGLIPKEHNTLQSAIADACAASIPPTSGIEVAFTKGTIL